MLSLLLDFESVMSTIGRVLLAFVILMFMILIHETGHYTAGKILKFKINEFAVGMGPKILSHKKKNGEVVSLRLLPLGGFCAFEGEDGDSPSEGSFNSQKPWKRLIVLFSGAFFNFVSAVLICIFLFGVYGETVAQVNYVYEYAPAENQILEPGDIIYKINGKNVFVLDDLSRYMDDEMEIVVIRGSHETNIGGFSVMQGGEEVTIKGVTRQQFYSVSVATTSAAFTSTDGSLTLTEGITLYRLYNKDDPSEGGLLSSEGDFETYLNQITGDTCVLTVVAAKGYDEKGDYDGTFVEYMFEIPTEEVKSMITVTEASYTGVGMSISYTSYKSYFGNALLRVLPYCGEVALLVLRTLGGLFTGAVGLNDIGGPVTTIKMTSQVVSYGFPNILRLIVLISVNLAVFNLLPVPALDGCRMVFVVIEWIARRPINRKVEAWINGIGLILLLGFVILVDILKL